jgi:hypothetical protein
MPIKLHVNIDNATNLGSRAFGLQFLSNSGSLRAWNQIPKPLEKGLHLARRKITSKLR